MRLLLDTAVLIFAVESPVRLSKRAAFAIQNPANVLEVNSVSLAEIAIKARLGKLQLTPAVVRQALEDLGARILPYTADHAFELFDLPFHHADPFDRQIIAQALSEDIAVVTSDNAFRLYEDLRVLW